MKVPIVFNHPYEGSYCATILEKIRTGLAAGGHERDLIQLDRDDFDTVIRA